MAKNFTDFNYTYGVGMEFKATSAKQVKDELKLNLDTLSKMVKSYSKVLKIDPNADLSKLYEEMRKIQGMVDGINKSDNPFSSFVDKGVLSRIANLESGLATISATSKEVENSLAGLTSSVVSMTEVLKAAGSIKFPATFDNLFGNVKDQSAQIKNTKDQIKAIGSMMSQLDEIYAKIEKKSGGGAKLSDSEIFDLLAQFDDLKEKLSNISSLSSGEISSAMKELESIGIKFNSAIKSLNADQLKSFKIDDKYVLTEIDDLLYNLEEKQKELSNQLKKFEAEQSKFVAKNEARTSSGKSLGVQTDYTAQVKVDPKTNEAEWTKKINDTIANIEPNLKRVHLTPTFSKGKNIKNEVEGSLAQINHAVNVDLQVVDNIDQFNQKIQNIDQSIKNAKAQLEKEGNFKIKFEYEEGGKFRDAAYKIINQFKKIETKFYIANGKKFIQDVTGLRNKAKSELKDITASIIVGNQDSVLNSVDSLRTEIDKKIGNIGVNLTLKNIPQFMAQAAMMRDSIEEYYSKNPIDASSGANNVDNASNSIVNLSENAKKAQEKIEKIKNTLKSLSELGFKSPDFLKLGAFDKNLKPIKDSKKQIEQFLQQYEALYKKVYASKDELRNTYGANEAGYAAYQKDLDMLRQIEDVLNAVVQSQIKYANQQLEASEKILAKETQIVEVKKEQAKVQTKDSSNQKSTQQLAMSAEEATKKIRSLNGTLTQQKKVLKDLEENKFNSSSFAKLGEWDKETNSFKKNSQEIKQLVQRYKELRDARIAAGGKNAIGEEASIRGKLSAILREQKKHVTEIISKNQEELESAKKIAAAYKQASDSKSKATSTKAGTDTATEIKHLDELVAKLNKAKDTLKLLKSNKFDALGSTGLGDVKKRLESLGSKQTFDDLINLYNRLIAKRNELEKAGKTGSAEYIEYAKVYQGIEEQLNVIYKDQLKYTQSRIKQLEAEIAKEQEILQLKTQQTKEDSKQTKTESSGQTSTNAGVASATVKLDGTTLNSLAKDATLKSIDGKINSIMSKLGNGIKITGSNISIEASNVAVKSDTTTTTGSKSANQNAGSKEVKAATLSGYTRQLVLFEEQIKRSGLYTDEFKKRLTDLHDTLEKVRVQDDVDAYKIDLDRFKEDFAQLQTYDKLYQDFVKSQSKQIQLKHNIATSSGSTAEMQEQLKVEEQISKNIEVQLNEYSTLYTQRARQLAIEEAINKANQQIASSAAAQSDKDINKQNADISKIVTSAQKKLSEMQYSMSNFKIPMADSAVSKLKEYEQLLTTLKRKQQEIRANPDLLNNENYSKGFALLLQQMQKVQGEFTTLQKSSESFLSKIRSIEDVKSLGTMFDATNLEQMHDAMQEFANQAGVGTAKLIEFNDVERTATFEINNGKGQVQQLTVAYDEATHSLGRFASQTRTSLSETQKFFNSLKHSFQNVARYIMSFGSVYRLFAMIKQGVTYVREIDSALTELKKVTDETDSSYNKFLQDMSKTASVVGSTVADLTTMASEWARLGYSMEEAGKLAESTAILLNVSEFDDATKASEALISTMQAFSYTADQSQHVVDILNEVKFTCLLIQ